MSIISFRCVLDTSEVQTNHITIVSCRATKILRFCYVICFWDRQNRLAQIGGCGHYIIQKLSDVWKFM